MIAVIFEFTPAPGRFPDYMNLVGQLKPELDKTFKPAFLGRLKVVPFYPVGDDTLVRIIRLKLDRIKARVLANHRAAFEYDEALVEIGRAHV